MRNHNIFFLLMLTTDSEISMASLMMFLWMQLPYLPVNFQEPRDYDNVAVHASLPRSLRHQMAQGQQGKSAEITNCSCYRCYSGLGFIHLFWPRISPCFDKKKKHRHALYANMNCSDLASIRQWADKTRWWGVTLTPSWLHHLLFFAPRKKKMKNNPKREGKKVRKCRSWSHKKKKKKKTEIYVFFIFPLACGNVRKSRSYICLEACFFFLLLPWLCVSVVVWCIMQTRIS